MSTRVVASSALAATAILLAGCGGGASAHLRALEDDPLARWEPAGGRLIESRGENGHSTLGKPAYASYRRLFELPAGDPAVQLRRAVAATEAVGWTITGGQPFRSAGALTQVGRKRLPSGEADVAITVFPAGPPSGKTRRPAMLVLMRHLGS